MFIDALGALIFLIFTAAAIIAIATISYLMTQSVFFAIAITLIVGNIAWIVAVVLTPRPPHRDHYEIPHGDVPKVPHGP